MIPVGMGEQNATEPVEIVAGGLELVSSRLPQLVFGQLWKNRGMVANCWSMSRPNPVSTSRSPFGCLIKAAPMLKSRLSKNDPPR